jgi:hypothetical protein
MTAIFAAERDSRNTPRTAYDVTLVVEAALRPAGEAIKRIVDHPAITATMRQYNRKGLIRGLGVLVRILGENNAPSFARKCFLRKVPGLSEMTPIT